MGLRVHTHTYSLYLLYTLICVPACTIELEWTCIIELEWTESGESLAHQVNITGADLRSWHTSTTYVAILKVMVCVCVCMCDTMLIQTTVQTSLHK